MIHDLEIEVIDASDSLAIVHLRPRLPETANLPTDLRIAGTLHGPTSTTSRTLPTTFTIEHKEERALVAVVRVIDPCFWSPENPLVYELDLELHAGEEIVARYQDVFGLRRGPR